MVYITRFLPLFVPICSDFLVFFRFVPICAPCFQDLFWFVPISSDLFSEQMPFCQPLLQTPDTWGFKRCGSSQSEDIWGTNLVAPYCAIPRDYLSDTPLLRAMGFLVSQHGQLGAIPTPPFLSVSPMKSMRSEDAIPPPQKGYLSDTGAIPYENKANGCDTPLCDTISKGYCAIWEGVSHWAAKGTKAVFLHCLDLPCALRGLWKGQK